MRARTSRLLLLFVLVVAGCPSKDGGGGPTGFVRAAVMTSADVIGGADSVGAAGDFILENDRVRFVIQAAGTAKAYGFWGGTIVDADRKRPTAEPGNDQLYELIPCVSVYVTETATVEVLRDGSNRKSAAIRARGPAVPLPGPAAELFTLFGASGLQFDIVTDYVIRPDTDVVEIVTTIESRQDALPVLLRGDLVLTGGNQTDIAIDLDPVVTYATAGRDVSYAYGDEEGASTTLFDIQGNAEALTLDDGETTKYSRFLGIGTGDGATARAAIWEATGTETGTFESIVLSGGLPVPGAVVSLEHENENDITTYITGEDGRFGGPALPGTYTATATVEGRADGPIPVTVEAGETTGPGFALPPVARLSIQVTEVDDLGVPIGPVPAEVILVRGTERRAVLAPDGTATVDVMNGFWRVLVTRGVEYTLFDDPAVEAITGQTVTVNAEIERVVDTTGWIASDFHVHARPSHDSRVWDEDRVAAMAGLGIEYFVGTDHDYVTDYEPVIAAMGLTSSLKTAIGVETTTWLIGHFNVWPLVSDPAAPRRGAPSWFDLPPTQLFQTMRDATVPEGVVQVNHPRHDSGYLRLIEFDPVLGVATRDPAELGFAPTEELLGVDFDAIEIFNGKTHGEDTQELFGEPGVHAGSLVDYFSLLNVGHRYTFTGNSDTHGTTSNVGMPRNYVRSATDSPAAIDDFVLAADLKAGHSVVSGGPFVTLTASTAGGANVTGVGDELDVGAGPASVDLHVLVQAPPWVDVDRILVFQNGALLTTVAVPPSTNAIRYDDIVPVTVTADSWFLLQVDGDLPLDPVFVGRTPLSFTNPVRVDVDGNGWTPPGL